MSITTRLSLLLSLAISSCSPMAAPSVVPAAPNPTRVPPAQSTTPTRIIASQTSTVTPHPSTPTWTPLPTLSEADALLRVDELMTPQPGCPIPCWWGITVGETPWPQARQAFKAFASEILDWSTVTAEKTDGPHILSTYYVYYPVRGLPNGGGMAITTRDGIVHTLFVNTDSTSKGLSFSEILARYGRPSIVLVRTVHDIAPFGFPFQLLLFYEDQRFMALYQLEAKREGQDVVACPASTPPAITIWGPHTTWTDEDIQTYALGPDYYHALIPLSKSTAFTIDTLYEASQREQETLCIRSPASLW